MHTNEQKLSIDDEEERIDLIEKCEKCLLHINGIDGHKQNCKKHFSCKNDDDDICQNKNGKNSIII